MHNDSIRIFIKYNSKVPCLLGWHTIDQIDWGLSRNNGEYALKYAFKNQIE